MSSLIDIKLPEGFQMKKSVKVAISNIIDKDQSDIFRRLMARAQYFAEEEHKKYLRSKGKEKNDAGEATTTEKK